MFMLLPTSTPLRNILQCYICSTAAGGVCKILKCFKSFVSPSCSTCQSREDIRLLSDMHMAPKSLISSNERFMTCSVTNRRCSNELWDVSSTPMSNFLPNFNIFSAEMWQNDPLTMIFFSFLNRHASLTQLKTQSRDRDRWWDGCIPRASSASTVAV